MFYLVLLAPPDSRQHYFKKRLLAEEERPIQVDLNGTSTSVLESESVIPTSKK